MRSEGQVRFIKLSAKFQMVAAGIAVSALLAWAITLGLMGWAQYRAQADISSLVQRETKVASAEERMAEYRRDLDAVTEDLTSRQKFIEDMVSTLPDDAKLDAAELDGQAGAAAADSTSEAERLISKVSALIPEAGVLARIEAQQLAFVERLTAYADQRSARAVSTIRELGLDPNVMLRSASNSAMGGPFELLEMGANGKVDPRFERLGLSLSRMAALERGLDGVPQVMPSRIENISSGFGFRSDPFTGEGAMHSGLDFRGPQGAPIHAAANGRVSFVGTKAGYGNVVEIDHGNGLMTRYAHMSKFAARPGQPVTAGHVIGAIGSTGRSTGPHLHFEVRINGRAVNPRPFLEYAPDVLKEDRSSAPHSSAHKHGK